MVQDHAQAAVAKHRGQVGATQVLVDLSLEPLSSRTADGAPGLLLMVSLDRGSHGHSY